MCHAFEHSTLSGYKELGVNNPGSRIFLRYERSFMYVSRVSRVILMIVAYGDAYQNSYNII